MATYRKYTKDEYETTMLMRIDGLAVRHISLLLKIDKNILNNWIYGYRKPPSAWTEEEIEAHNDYRRKRCGSLHPSWKGDKAGFKAGRKRARKIYSTPEGYERHHIDGNPLNNDPSNIAIVTPREHQIMDGRLERSREYFKTHRPVIDYSRIRHRPNGQFDKWRPKNE